MSGYVGAWLLAKVNSPHIVTSRSFPALFSAKRIITSTFLEVATLSLLSLKDQYMEVKRKINNEKEKK